MQPAFSVIFLTTLIGVGQGLFLALFTGESYSAVQLLPTQSEEGFYALGSLLSLAFLTAGLGASFFHLGRPERAWRSAARWRTSWLSREVIALPTVMALVFLYGTAHYLGWDIDLTGTGQPGQLTLVLGGLGTAATFALFLCTGMIYAAIKFLPEWSTPLTVVNYLLLGTASGFTLATAFASLQAPALVAFYGTWAIVITAAALFTRGGSLLRNARIKHHSTVQSAIGVRHPRIEQKAMGMMGGSFNTREFFHGRTAVFLKSIKWIFLLLVFPLPALLLWGAIAGHSGALALTAFAVQYAGLLFERWFFFAQTNHPQNIYYQTI